MLRLTTDGAEKFYHRMREKASLSRKKGASFLDILGKIYDSVMIYRFFLLFLMWLRIFRLSFMRNRQKKTWSAIISPRKNISVWRRVAVVESEILF